MNIKRMKQLADHLRSIDSTSETGFYIGVWYEEGISDWRGNECKSVACIAGHAVILFGDIESDTATSTTREMAQEYLELTYNQAHALFTPDWPGARNIVSPKKA
ncbi:MAG: hypothetical protein MN733_18725, partial [Nitrososphaera sp.]|nr:hypothetical protein [Nitrososphaera sp.]